MQNDESEKKIIFIKKTSRKKKPKSTRINSTNQLPEIWDRNNST